MTREYALSAVRTAVLRARLIASEAETIGIALKNEMISVDAAFVWARDAGALDFVSQDDIESADQEMDLAS